MLPKHSKKQQPQGICLEVVVLRHHTLYYWTVAECHFDGSPIIHDDYYSPPPLIHHGWQKYSMSTRQRP